MEDTQKHDDQLSISDDKNKLDHRKTVLSYLHDLTYLLCGILVVFLLLFRVVIVSGSSMNNTLIDGDYLLPELLL